MFINDLKCIKYLLRNFHRFQFNKYLGTYHFNDSKVSKFLFGEIVSHLNLN